MKRINLKILAVVTPIFILAAAFVYSFLANPFNSSEIFCSALAKTGIKCPTCGLTRAIYSIIIGDFKTAFYYHALFTVGFIPLTVALTGMGLNFYLGKRILPLPKYRWTYFYILLAVVILFTVARNLTNLIY